MILEARKIFIAIKQKIRFQQSEKDKDSHYTILGNTLVRISNHCTWMKVWENYFNEHPECRNMNIVSIVFEDAGDTFCEECLFTIQPRQKPIIVTEYVYKSNTIQKGIVKAITKSLQEMDYTNQYIEPTHIIQPQTRVSKNPPTNESKIHKNMKNVKQINKGQLRAIVAESIKKVLTEKYNPFKRNDTEDGVEFPRYEKDTAPYKEKLSRQAEHLYDQIEYFLQTLEHAYPNPLESKAKNGNRSFGYEELESNLESAKRKLIWLVHPHSTYDGGADYSTSDYGY